MPFTELDDAPKGFTPLDDGPKGFTPVDDGPAPEGAFQSFLRPIESNIFPALATAGGGVAGAFLGGGAGTVAEPGGGTIAGGIAGDIAGGTAAGAAAQALQNKVLGDETVKSMQAQEASNMAEHPFWSKMGTMIGQIPALLGGGAGFAKTAAKEGRALTTGERVAEAGAQGGRMGGAQAAGQEVQGNQDISIPEEILKGALTFGPTGLLKPATSLLYSVGVKAPSDAAIMATSNALYDKVVHGKDIDPEALGKQIGADVPGFMLLNGITHVLHNTPGGVKAPNAEQFPAAQAVAEEPAKQKIVTGFADDTAAQLEALGASKTAEVLKNTTDATVVKNEINPTNAGETDEGQQEPTAPTEIQPEISQEIAPESQQPALDENALQEPSPSSLLQHPQEGTGEAGSERGGVEQEQQGSILAEAQSSDEPPVAPPVVGEVNPPAAAELPPSQDQSSGPAGSSEGSQAGEKVDALGSTHAETIRQRQELNLPEIVKDAPRNIKESFDRAAKLVEANPEAPKELVDKLSKEPGSPINEDQQALLTHHTVAIHNALRGVEEELSKPEITPEEKASAQVRLEKLTEDLNQLHDVNFKAGSAWGRSGRWRQELLNRDFSLENILRRRAKLADRNLTPDEVKQATKEAAEHKAEADKYGEMTKANEEAAEKEGGETILEHIKKKPTIKKIEKATVQEKLKQAVEGIPERGEIESSLAPEVKTTSDEQDRAYLEAAQKGDTETAQRMVNEAAKGARQVVPRPDFLKHFSQSDFGEFIQDIDGYGKLDASDGYKREIFDSWKSKLKSKGVEFIDGYHVSDSGKPDFETKGIEGSEVDSVGAQGGNRRENSVYMFLDPDDILDSYAGVLGSRKSTPNVVHVKIPVDRLGDFRWDSNFNITYGTYSGVRLLGNIPFKEVHGIHPFPISADPITRDSSGNVIPLSERFNPKSNDIRYSTSHGQAGDVTTEHQKEAVAQLNKSQIGKNLLRGVIIVPDWERALSNENLRSFSSAEINRIKRSEGFYDPQSGKVVVIRENIVPKEGETPTEALARVLTHERIGHEGARWMLDNDPQFRKAFHEAAALIPQAELDHIAEAYGHLEGNSDALINEWFARNVESLKPDELPDPKTAFGKMWQAVKDFLARVLGHSTNLDQKVRDLASLIARNPDAFEGRKGLEGELETQHALAPKKKLSDLPHSVLDLLARYHVQEGAKTEPELTKAMHETLKEHFPDVTESDVRRAHSEYGKVIKPTKDAIGKVVADLKGQQRLISGLEDVKQGFMAKLKGRLADKSSPEYRALDKELNDEIVAKKLRKQDETQRSSPLDKKISTLFNAIADTEKEITDLRAGGVIKYRSRSKVINDAEADKLETKLKVLRAEKDQVIKERGGDPVEIAKKIKSTNERIAELEGKIDRNELDVPKKEPSPSNPELDAARKRLKQANDTLSEKRAERDKPARDAEKVQNDLDNAQARLIQLEAKLQTGDIARNPVKRKEVVAELQSVRDQIKGLNKGIAKARSDAEKPAREAKAAAKELADAKERVADMEKKLATGDLSTKERSVARSVPAELAAERETLKELNKEMAGKRADLESYTPPTEQEYREALAATKKKNAAKIAENEKRIATGDFEPRLKPKPYSDSETELQKIKLLKQQQKIRNGNRQLALAARSGGKKFWDNVVKVKRALVLTSAAVYGKLAAAAVVRGGLTGVEDFQGGVLKRILPKAVTDKALIESGSSSKALAKGFTSAFMKGLSDAKDTVTTGQSPLDLLHGKPKADDEIWHSFLGRLHGAVKAPVKRAAFEYAMEKQAGNYIAQGVDITEPLIQAKMAGKAYEYANKAIFMQDNAITTAWQLALNYLHNKGGGAAGLARAMRILLPIVKVPTNIAGEALTYAGGVPFGLARLGKAWSKGFENLKPEEADLILNQLKKGSLGSGLLLMGFFNPQMFGGYYQKGIKRDEKDVEYGGARVGDTNIPKMLLHAPAFEILQVGSTMRRVADSRLNKHSDQRGLTAGAMAGALGLASEVPFMNEMIRSGDLQSPEGRDKYFGELAKAQVVPAVLDQYARHEDVNSRGEPIKRDAKTFTDVIKSGIPGLRETVPQKKPPAVHKTS